MKRIFVTHIAPREMTIKLGVSLSATNFNYNLIEGNIFDKVYSILPAFVAGKHEFESSKEIEYIYSRWRTKNRFLRRFAQIAENISLFKRIEKNSSVWFYNTSTLNVLTMILLMLFKRSVKVNIIILDYTPTDFLCKCFLPIINKCHGRILLANSPLFNKDNSVILPGVTPIDEIDYPKVTEIKKEFLISGVLGENIAMMSMLLEAFSKMPHLTLHITGVINDDSKIKEYANKYENIKYHGCVLYNEYISILHNTPFLLSTRNPDFPENQCNFPSKIIEALLHNRIIVSTLHYEQLNGIKYLEVPSDTNGFTNAIEKISKMEDHELMQYANQSQSVHEKFNTEVWNSTMKKIEDYEKEI